MQIYLYPSQFIQTNQITSLLVEQKYDKRHIIAVLKNNNKTTTTSFDRLFMTHYTL